MSIPDYVTNVDQRNNLPYRYHGDMGYYYVNGEPKRKEEIDKLFPIDKEVQKLGTRYKGENPDTTKIK